MFCVGGYTRARVCVAEWETENRVCYSMSFCDEGLFNERDGKHIPFGVPSLPVIDGVRMRLDLTVENALGKGWENENQQVQLQ